MEAVTPSRMYNIIKKDFINLQVENYFGQKGA